jgi:hypothetical protein
MLAGKRSCVHRWRHALISTVHLIQNITMTGEAAAMLADCAWPRYASWTDQRDPQAQQCRVSADIGPYLYPSLSLSLSLYIYIYI